MDLIQIGTDYGYPRIVLQGTGMASPVRGAVLREPGLPDGESVEQGIEVSLEGTPAQIEAFLETLGRELAYAAAEALLPGGDYRYLDARVLPGGMLMSTKILGGRVELLGGGAGQRAGGSQGVLVRLRRVDYWEGPLTWLPLTNGNGIDVADGILVYNHADTDPGHQNYTAAASSAASGELPAPARLEFTGLDTGGTGTLYAGQSLGDTGAVYSIEGEAGTAGAVATGTVTAVAGASKGYYLRLAWNGSAELTLWQKTLDPAQLAAYQGRAYLPLLRLQNVNTETGLWYAWRIAVNYGGVGQAAYDTPGGWLLTGANTCPGTALFLPPWPVESGDLPPGVGLELRIRANGAGTHILDFDCLHLLPLDGWRIYRPVAGSYSGLSIVDDPYRGTLKTAVSAIQMHQAEGPGLMVYPGRSSRYLFAVEGSGGSFSADTRGTVRIGYHPRKRGL